MELKEQLINRAVRAHGCVEGVAQLDGAATKEEMVQCFIDRIDFCLANNFPDKEYLKKNFKRELRDKGIYIDEPVNLHNGSAVLLGGCIGKLMADEYAVCRLYVKHTSALTIEATDNAFVMVDALDETRVEVKSAGKGRVVVNLYAQAHADATGDGLTKIIQKNKDTYDL